MKQGFDNFSAVDSESKQNNVINDEYLNIGGFLGNVVNTVTGAVQSGVQTVGNLYESGLDIIQGQTTGANQSGCVRPLGYALDKLKLRQSSRNYDACLAAANAVDPDTQAFQNLIAQLPQKYQTALESANLSYDLNATQQQALIDVITGIAKNSALSGSAKLTNSIKEIEKALPYLKESPAMTSSASAGTGGDTKGATTTGEGLPTWAKWSIGIGSVAVIGVVTYVIIKKRK